MKYQTLTLFLRTKYPEIYSEYIDHVKVQKCNKNKAYRANKKANKPCLIVESDSEKESVD
jgi:hypothetical protein